jgi:hypothetical protein
LDKSIELYVEFDFFLTKYLSGKTDEELLEDKIIKFSPAPFKDKKGNLFRDIHIIWLSEGDRHRKYCCPLP